MKIDIEMLQQIQAKVQQIVSLPFSLSYYVITGLVLSDADGITVNTEQYNGGSDWDTTSDYISYDDLIKPIEWWADKFKNEEDKRQQKKVMQAEKQRQLEEKQDYEKYLSLKSKFQGK